MERSKLPPLPLGEGWGEGNEQGTDKNSTDAEKKIRLMPKRCRNFDDFM